VRAEATRLGVGIVGTEIIGLVPERALEMTAAWYLRVENFAPGIILENRLDRR
jgi:glutamate formiminotransferase